MRRRLADQQMGYAEQAYSEPAASLPDCDYDDFASWLDRVCSPLALEIGDEYRTSEGEPVTIASTRLELGHLTATRYYQFTDGLERTANQIRCTLNR